MLESSQKFFDFLENATTVGVAICEEQEKILFANKTLSNLLGYSEEELKNLPFLSLFDLQHTIEQLKEKKHFSVNYEQVVFHTKDDQVKIFSIFINSIEIDDKLAAFMVFVDITKQKFFQTLFLSLKDINQLIIKANTQDELFEKMSELLIKDLGFSLVVIGKIEKTNNLNIVYKLGAASHLFDSITISVDGESDYGKGTAHLACKTNTVIVNQDTRTNPLMKFWKDKLLEQGLNSNCAIPITKNGKIHYIILIYSKISNFFSSQMLPILRELKDDIEFALIKIHMQESLKSSIRFYNTLSQINQLIIKSSSKKDVFEKICDIFIKYGDFDLAGLFLIDDKAKLTLTYYASKDPHDIDYLAYANDQFQNAQENWPTIKAKNKKHIFINNDTEQNKNLNIFKSKMLEHKLFSSCALPIMQNNKLQGVINLYSKKSHIFDKNIYNLLREIVGDISYALDKFESQKWIQIFSVALNSSYDFVVIADCKFNIVYVNDNTLFAFGYKKEELIGKNHRIFSSGLHTKEFVENFYKTLKDKKIFSDIFLYRTKNGQIVQSYTTITPYEFDNEIYYVAIGKDLSKDKGLQLKLNHHINFDPVTELPNQKHFLEKIEAFVQDPIAQKYKSALIIIDPKDFANINTFYGFNIGDEVLKEIAKRLKNSVKSYEIAARLSENKFGLFVKELQTKEDILSSIENSRNILSKPFTTNYGNIYLEFSIGISFFPDNAKKAQELLSKAYVALKHAKEGRYIYKFYQKSDEESLIKQIQLKTDLEKAVKESEFMVYYQPYVDTTSNKICGAEALLRWKHNGTIITPSVFIETLETTGLIEEVEDFVIEKVSLLQKTFILKQKKCIPISINIAPNSFKSKSILKKLSKSIKKYGLNPKCLSIEILERLFIDNFDYIKQILSHIKGLGVSIALDDFGTGYSSLSYLSQLPLNTIKIDISFIRKLETDKISYQLVKAITSIAKQLDLTTIAEGVENYNQLKILKHIGINSLQGYLFYKPMDEKSFADLLYSTDTILY